MAGFRQELVGLFGKPVDENPTQAMVEAAFAAAGLDWRYLTIEVDPDGLGTPPRGARAMGFRGFNCTIPHKVAVVDHLDRLSQAGAVIGAVNCVVRKGDELVGENTDGAGFLAAPPPARTGRAPSRAAGRGEPRGRSASSSPWPAREHHRRQPERGARARAGAATRARGRGSGGEPRRRLPRPGRTPTSSSTRPRSASIRTSTPTCRSSSPTWPAGRSSPT